MYREAPVGLCYLDTELRYIHINEWLSAINGIPVKKHLGKKLNEVIPEVAKGIEWQLRQVIDTGEPILYEKVTVETPAQPGVIICLEHCFYSVKSDDGVTLGVSCVVQDVTEREHLRKVKLATGNIQLVELLTNREHDILTMVERRLYNKEIAEQLSISIETVKTHLKHAYKKLEVNNRRQAIGKLNSLKILHYAA